MEAGRARNVVATFPWTASAMRRGLALVRVGWHSTANSELVRTRGIRMSNQTKALRRPSLGVAAMFLPNALNDKVEKLNQARVNDGSGSDSFNVATYVVI